MLAVLLKIISVLGIILLILLGILLLVLLLILFFPVCYRLDGKRNIQAQEMYVRVKADWLFGLVRLRYIFPKPGILKVKLLWFTVFDSAAEEKSEDTARDERKSKNPEVVPPSQVKTEQTEEREPSGQEDTPAAEALEDGISCGGPEEQEKESLLYRIKCYILEKYEKIRYTFQSIYDKIKHIWQNISYYKELLQEEDTRLLFSCAGKRMGKILKSIRPRKLRADIVFGTGSPDTTGYAYGIYGMISPKLGNKVVVVPDFTQAVLEGEFYAAGYLTLFHILWNGTFLLLDKRLRSFIGKCKTGWRSENGR